MIGQPLIDAVPAAKHSPARRATLSVVRSSGFTIVELMIAIVLGSLLILAISTVFISGSKSLREDDRYARLQENGRFAIHVLADDLGAAGFWGETTSNAATSTTLTTTCNIAFNLATPIVVLDAPTAANAKANFDCIDDTKYYVDPGWKADVLAIKRVRGAQPASIDGTKAYLEIVGTTLAFKQGSSISTGISTNVSPWEFIPHIYYIRNYSTTVGDGIPTLVRKYLDSATTVSEEVLAEGIENLQIEFGLDTLPLATATTTTPGDGFADVYVTTLTAAQAPYVVNARIYVLARSVDRDVNHQDNKTYALGSAPIPAKSDNYYRRVFVTTVTLRNNIYATGLARGGAANLVLP